MKRLDDYPPEYDLPDDSEWEGSRLADICEVIQISPPSDALRCIDKYGDEGATVSIALPNGERFYVPDDLPKIRALADSEPVAAWIIHGIAWDGSDWEYSEEVATAREVPDALLRFADHLEEWLEGDA